ncbi:MAG: hypothetical protein PHN44_00710 [Candidatus Marinimicrobia bacterium]|nr:hypothetical protein [Candidatus Neomarinimicrobiota bacterium]MDD5539113.1 hypothetical protein [Candidatus Neomarinimicrobiota bacterium]
MKVNTSGLFIDNPAFPLLTGLFAYQGVTTANGNAGGTTWADAGLATEPSYNGHYIKILSGPAAGEGKPILAIVAGVGTVTSAFSDAAGAPIQITAGTRYVILSQDSSLAIALLAGLAVPVPDSVDNILERDVIGNKEDAAVIVVDITTSIIAYVKGLINQIATALLNMAVPAADAVANALHRDVIGNKTSTPVYTPDNVSDQMRYQKGNMNTINMLVEAPVSHVVETFQSELGMPEALFEWTHPATGTPWNILTNGAYRVFYTIPAASENARLNGRRLWLITPSVYGTNLIQRKTICEWVIRLTNVANIDNAGFLFGLTPLKADTRASNNIIGFGLVGDALQTITDLAGVETVNTGFGETLTNVNKFRIEAYAGHVKFFLNEVQIADHVTNLANLPMYQNIYILNEAGGTSTFELMSNRMWVETIAR